jgi:hypothetical protein
MEATISSTADGLRTVAGTAAPTTGSISREAAVRKLRFWLALLVMPKM